MFRRILLAPDSYKGCLSAVEVCGLMTEGIHTVFPDIPVTSLPLADGGEGSVECFLTALPEGERIETIVTGPLTSPVTSFWGWWPGRKLAVIEMAACAGLPLMGNKADPTLTTTYGVGQLMTEALEKGAEEIYLCLGGSATHDMGCGCAAALGAKFLDQNGDTFLPTGGTLDAVREIDLTGMDARLSHCRVAALCDIDNPLLGERGAATIFAPQKGADPACVMLLEENTALLAQLCHQQFGKDFASVPGAGAAGGMGAGVMAFLGGSLQPGIDTVLQICGFREHLQSGTLVLTGEGKTDSQSLGGKVLSGVASRCKAAHIPLWVIAGDLEEVPGLYEAGITVAFSTNHRAVPFVEAKKTARQDLLRTVENIFRALRDGLSGD